jgi:hypothetical protein
MLSPGSISRRGAIRSAAAGLTLLAMGVTGEYSANAQQVALDATQRPVNLVIPPNAAPPAPNPRHVFSTDECRHIRTAISVMFGRVGPDKLSNEFRQSMIAFLMPDGQRSTCTGPRTIAWRTRVDAATFNSIAGLLQTPSSNVYILRAGVELAPAPVASLSLQ